MEGILVSVTSLATIILCIVGVVKLPFSKLKKNRPKWYKAIFFVLSLVLVVGGSILVQLCILGGSLASVDFACLILGTAIAVVGGYAAYENLPLKELVHKAIEAIKTWSYSDKKVAKMLNKVGLDKVISVANALEEQKKAAELAQAEAAKTQEVEPSEVQTTGVIGSTEASGPESVQSTTTQNNIQATTN